MAMNLLYYKAEVSGRPEEDPETHLLRIVDWMDTHNFAADQRVRKFALTLAGEARL